MREIPMKSFPGIMDAFDELMKSLAATNDLSGLLDVSRWSYRYGTYGHEQHAGFTMTFYGSRFELTVQGPKPRRWIAYIDSSSVGIRKTLSCLEACENLRQGLDKHRKALVQTFAAFDALRDKASE